MNNHIYIDYFDLLLTESDSSDDDSSSDEDLSLDVSLNEINGRLLNNAIG